MEDTEKEEKHDIRDKAVEDKSKEVINDPEARIKEMLEAGELIPAVGKLWEAPMPTYVVKGTSASEGLIEERRSYL